MKKITFLGHFDIGEKLTISTKTLIELSRNEKNTDYCVFIGDVGIDKKILAYFENGINGVKNIYRRRLSCAKSTCTIAQLPKSELAINELVDEQQFIFAKQVIEHELLGRSPSTENIRPIIQKIIVPSIICNRLKIYDLPFEKTLVLREKTFRNRVGKRIKKTHSSSWHTIKYFRNVNKTSYFIGNQKIVNENGNPICRGIMFSLFEYLSIKGYESIKFYVETRHLKSVFMGWTTFFYMKKNIPYLPNSIYQAKFIIA